MFGGSWKNPSRALALAPDPSRALQSVGLGQDPPTDLDLDVIK